MVPAMHAAFQSQMSYNLNSVKGVIHGILGSIIGLIYGETKSLDYSSDV